MRVLNISLDKKLFEENSQVRERVLEYAKIFDRFDVLVLAGKGCEKIESGNVAIWPANSRNKFFLLLDAYRQAKKMVEQNRLDLISAQDPFFTGFVGWLLKRRTGLPLQIQIHTDFLSPYFRQESLLNKIRVLLAKFLIPRADGIRVVSERIKKSLNSKIQNLKPGIIVLPIFVDVKKIQETPVKFNLRDKYPQFDFIALIASRLTKEKNVNLAIEAFAEVAKNHPKTGLVIAGEGLEEKSLKSKVQSSELRRNIFFEPWMDNLASYYKTADIFLSTSNYEGYGLAIVEAMACGLSPVMTDVGCAGEIVKNGESGLVVPVGGSGKLARAVLKLLNDVELRKRLTQGARQAISGLMSKEESLGLYKKSCEQILKRNK